MKFSKKKKAKMRRIRQKRVDKNCRDMIGFIVDYDCNAHVVDQTKIDGTHYLLAELDNNQYAIYKIVSVHECVKLSAKKVLLIKDKLSDCSRWYLHSDIRFSDSGDIVSVEDVIAIYSFVNNKLKVTYVTV